MALARFVIIAGCMCVLMRYALSRADRRECPPYSTDPTCLPAMEFNHFFNIAKKHRRFAKDSASSDFMQKNRKYDNWPSFHPPLKSTPSFSQSTTASTVKQTPKDPIFLLPPPPPITYKPKTPNKNRPNLKKKNTSPLPPTKNSVFNNLDMGQTSTLKDSSKNFKTLQNNPFSLKVNANKKTPRQHLSDKINRSLGVSSMMPIEITEFVTSENAGRLKTSKRISKERKQNKLKKQNVATIRQHNAQVDVETTPTFSNPILSSTFNIIRNSKRIRTNLQKVEETNTTEEAETLLLQTLKWSSVNTKHPDELISQTTTSSTLHTTLSVIQDLKTSSEMVLPVQAMETSVKLRKATTTEFDSEEMFTTTMTSVIKTAQTEQPLTTDRKLPAKSKILVSTTTKKNEFRTVGSFKTDGKILTMLSPTVSAKYTTTAMNQGSTVRTQQIPALQTTEELKSTSSSNKPNKSKNTPVHINDIYKEDNTENKKSDIINCDPLSSKKRHFLNASSRNGTFFTTTLSVKIKAPQEDWTISDNRASAVGIGSLGVVVIVAIIGGVICLDAATLYRDAKRIRKKIYRIFKPLQSNNKDKQVSKKLPKWAHFVTTRDA